MHNNLKINPVIMRQKLMLLVSILVLTTWSTFAKHLNYFNYTLQIRVDGKVLVNEINKNIIVTIYKSDKVTAVFSETISNVSTNNIGICKFNIGSGVPILTGSLVKFNSIDWGFPDYTVGFNWDGQSVRTGNKSLFDILPYAISADLAINIDTLRSKISDTIIVIADLEMLKKNILDLNILNFNNNETIDNTTDGQIKISADSTYISGILKIDSLKSFTQADIVVSNGFNLTNSSISGLKALKINPKTNSISGVTTIGKVVLSNGEFALPLYLDSDGIYKLYNNTVFEKSRCVALSTNSEESNFQPILLNGYIKKESWNFKKGDLIYINESEISNIKPTVTEHYVQQIGYAVDVNIIYFEPKEVGKISSLVIVSPSIQQFVKINEEIKLLTVTEFPLAQSRKWYYGTNANGPFDQYLSDKDDKMAIQSDFASPNTYFIVCKSVYPGNIIITSNPVKIFCWQNIVSPADPQSLKLNTLSQNKLTIATNPAATAYQWVYDENENGTYPNEILNSTSTTFTPIFKNVGKYFVKCRATMNNVYLYSNAIKVSVSGLSLIPSEEQFVKLGEKISQISVVDVAGSKRLWLYSSNQEGPFLNEVIGTSGDLQSITANQLPEGVNYVICESNDTQSNSVKVTVVKNLILPTLQFSSEIPNILTFDFGNSVPDSWIWYSGVDKNNITTSLQSLKTQTPLSMGSSDSLFYFVKAIYGTKTITSNIASVYSGLEIISPKKMVVRRSGIDTVYVRYRVEPDIFRWYKVGKGAELANNLIDKSKFIPINAAALTNGQNHKIYCLANYDRIQVSSDTIDIALANFRIVNKSTQIISKLNQLGNPLTLSTITPSHISLKWFSIVNSVTSEINGATTNSYTPKFGQAGEYKVFCEITLDVGLVYSDTIDIVVLDLRLTPQEKQVLLGDVEFSKEISIISTLPAGASQKWFVDNTFIGISPTFISKTFPVDLNIKNIFCDVNYKGVSYLTDTIEVIAGKLSITTPSKKYIYINKGVTKTFTALSVLDNSLVTYSVRDIDGVKELGSNNSYKFLNSGDYIFYAKNKSYDKAPWDKIFKDTVKITVTDLFINSYDEQFIQLHTSINSLTVTTTLSTPSYKWKYGTTESSITQELTSGGGTSKTLFNFQPGVGTYYLKCEVTDGVTVKTTLVVKINILDNKIGPIAQQTVEANTNGTNLIASYTLMYDSLRWFKTVNSITTLIPNATDVGYVPNLAPKTWGISCKYYYHNTSGVVSVTSNKVEVKSVSIKISGADPQYLADMANCSTLNLVESSPSTTRQWYYQRSSDGKTMEPEKLLGNKDAFTMQEKFEKGYYYYIHVKSEYNFDGQKLIVESNKIQLVVPMVTITPPEDQPYVYSDSQGEVIFIKIMPSGITTTSVEWYSNDDATTMNHLTRVQRSNKHSVTPEVRRVRGAAAYMAAVEFPRGFVVKSENYVCIGSSRKISTPYLKNGAYAYGNGFYPRAGVPNNPKFCGIPSGPVPAGLYWVYPKGARTSRPIKAYCDGIWTSLGENQNTAFTNCNASGEYGPTRTQIFYAYLDTGMLSINVTSFSFFLKPDYTKAQSPQQWIVPVTGTYYIEAWGSRGGGAPGNGRGKGAKIAGYVKIEEGTKLQVVVGQYNLKRPLDGQYVLRAAGGGGGSYVWRLSDKKIYMIAGGGAGRSAYIDDRGSSFTYQHGQAGRQGGYYSQIATLGEGGKSSRYSGQYNTGGAGGGCYSKGETGPGQDGGYGGHSNLSANTGGFPTFSGTYVGNYAGGYGGGGASGMLMGGAGGGYTGGQGSAYPSPRRWAGGGGSYNSGMEIDGYEQINLSGVNDTIGRVIIKYKIH